MRELKNSSLVCLESDLKFTFLDLINREGRYINIERVELMKLYNDYFAPRVSRMLREFEDKEIKE